MIQCMGYYAILRGATTDASRSSSTSQFREMSILLEYGRFDLMGSFEVRLPPVNSPEIEEFWRSLIEVVDALKGIHDLKTQNGGYHGLVQLPFRNPVSLMHMQLAHEARELSEKATSQAKAGPGS